MSRWGNLQKNLGQIQELFSCAFLKLGAPAQNLDFEDSHTLAMLSLSKYDNSTLTS